jgi:outer membrane receptor protein involved in Fe transport
MLRRILAGALLCAMPALAFAQVKETIEVTATRIAEDVTVVPASVTIIDGDKIRARNATDLATALGLASGINAAGGSDSGPSSGVPEMWGLREVDAFLLVVDGVPWGGAFNPDLPTVDLTGVDRIEIVRGSAPVMYGATAFTGVIHIIHREAGSSGGDLRAFAGSLGSGGVAVTIPLASSSSLRQSLIGSVERRGFADEDAKVDRAHALYRAASGNFRFDADATIVKQDPASPHPRQGAALTALVPIDANHNPNGAKLDENRIHLVGGWSKDNLSATVAFTHSDFDIHRGFLAAINNDDPNAVGFSQDRDVNDIYLDFHAVKQFSPTLRTVFGFDHLYGDAHAENEIFTYFVPLQGGPASDEEFEEESELDDTRNFSGAYINAEWTPRPRWRVDFGARINHTREDREGEDGDDSRTVTRPSGSIGANWLWLQRGATSVSLFADYRNTYKPAALDFGPEAESEVLDVEKAQSIEAGAKGTIGERIRWQSSVFLMNFENLVLPTVRNGLPVLENAGEERFSGFETEFGWQLTSNLDFDLAYSYHDARFRDYIRDFDGTLTQLRGKRFEMSPYHLVGTGLTYAPASGWNGHVALNYSGERWLNKRNTAFARPYTTWTAGVGHELGRGELRVDVHNAFDVRPPVAESELGDGHYYRLGGREFELSWRMKL